MGNLYAHYKLLNKSVLITNQLLVPLEMEIRKYKTYPWASFTKNILEFALIPVLVFWKLKSVQIKYLQNQIINKHIAKTGGVSLFEI